MSKKNLKIKKVNLDNCIIRIKDLEVTDYSFYGTDADFHYDVIDRETNKIIFENEFSSLEWGLMGYEDYDDFDDFLEEKGITYEEFKEKYDEDFDKLPQEMKDEFIISVKERLTDYYYEEYVGEDLCEIDNDLAEKLLDNLYEKDSYYFIKDEKIYFLDIDYDYFGIHLRNNDNIFEMVYDINRERYIYKIKDTDYYFDIIKDFHHYNSYNIIEMKREKNNKKKVTGEDLENDIFPGYYGKIGEYVYCYDEAA